MGDDVNHSPDKAGKPTDAYQPSRLNSIEELPLALGFCIINAGRFRPAIEDGINSGRDTDSIGVMAGAILGALNGASVIDAADLALLDGSNRLGPHGRGRQLCRRGRSRPRRCRQTRPHRCRRARATAHPHRSRQQGRLTLSKDSQLNHRDIYERIYAGFIAKAIGVRLGAPVEPTIWTLERIEKTYGEVTEYLHDFRNFAADDDTNGPVYFIRVLRDYGLDFTAEQEGRTWLNYAAEEHGMYWWGRLRPLDRAYRLSQPQERHSGAGFGLARHQWCGDRRTDRRPDLHRQLGLAQSGQSGAGGGDVGAGRQRRA